MSSHDDFLSLQDSYDKMTEANPAFALKLKGKAYSFVGKGMPKGEWDTEEKAWAEYENYTGKKRPVKEATLPSGVETDDPLIYINNANINPNGMSVIADMSKKEVFRGGLIKGWGLHNDRIEIQANGYMFQMQDIKYMGGDLKDESNNRGEAHLNYKRKNGEILTLRFRWMI